MISRQVIRLLVEVTDRGELLDAVTGERPRLWRGTDVQFEIGFTKGGELIDDLSNFSAISLEVLAATRTGAPLMAASTASFTTGFTLDQFNAGTHQHLTITFTNGETALSLNSKTTEQFWLGIHGVTTDSPTRRVTFGGGTLDVEEDGVPSGQSPPAPLVNYFTGTESDARFPLRAESGANWCFESGQLKLISPNGTKFPIGVTDAGALVVG